MSAAGPDPTSGVELQTSPGARPSSASVNGVKLEDHTAQAATGHERKSSDHDQEQNRHNHAITASLEHGLEADDNDPVVAAEQNFLPPGPRLYLVVACLMLAVFCIALDNTVLAVAIPRITNEFKRLNHVGWYAASYLLTSCAFQLLYGKLYTLFGVKQVFLTALLLFELGSLLCALAPSSLALIMGRTVAGTGSSGIYMGSFVTLAHTIPLSRRPLFIGIIGGVFGLASVIGPLIGGAFTDHLSWRWCFYINLPIGGVTALILIFALRLKPPPKEKTSLLDTIKQLDLIGTTLFAGFSVSLLLTFYTPGEYSASDPRFISICVMWPVLGIAFVCSQWLNAKYACLPGRIALQKSMISASFFIAMIGGAFYTIVYFIPIWFQAIKGVTAVKSGIYTLPFILSYVLSALAAGAGVGRFGYYWPFLITSSIVAAIGGGLFLLLRVDSPPAKWILSQLVFGVGIGLGWQQGSIVAQTVLELPDIPAGMAQVFVAQVFGAAILVGAAQLVFAKNLTRNIVALNLKGIDASVILHAGATDIKLLVEATMLPRLLEAYNAALVETFKVAMVAAAVSLIGSLFVQRRSIKDI